jgi:hypothetical protein
MTVAEKSVHKPFQELLIAIWARVMIAIVVLGAILFLGICVMGGVAVSYPHPILIIPTQSSPNPPLPQVKVASGVVKPIQNLTGLVTRLNNRDMSLHASDVSLDADSPEMVAMLSAFQKSTCCALYCGLSLDGIISDRHIL